MKRFLLKIFLPSFIIVTLIFSLFEFALRSLPNDIKYKSEYLRNNGAKLKLLILGSSNTAMDLNPQYLSVQPSFNCAYSAQSLEFDEWIYKHYYDIFDSLQYIVLDMNYRELWHENTPSGKSPTYVKKYCIYYNLPYYKGFCNEFEISANITDIYNTIFNIKRQTSFRTVDSLGFQSGYYDDIGYDESEWKEYAKYIADYYDAGKVKDDVFFKNISYLYTIASMARQKGVVLIVLTCPVHRFLSGAIKKNQYQKMISVMNSLCEKFDNVRYYNFFYSTEFKDCEFYNVDHLNGNGSKHFTRIVDSIILGLQEEKKQMAIGIK